jgi:hypothetical protein
MWTPKNLVPSTWPPRNTLKENLFVMDSRPRVEDSSVRCNKALKCMLPRILARHARFWIALNARLGLMARTEPDFPTGQRTNTIIVMEASNAAKNVTVASSAPANMEPEHFAQVVKLSNEVNLHVKHYIEKTFKHGTVLVYRGWRRRASFCNFSEK